MKFLDNIIQHLNRNGTIDKNLLFEPPFTDANDEDLIGLFEDDVAGKIISLLDQINENANVGGVTRYLSNKEVGLETNLKSFKKQNGLKAYHR